MLLPNCVILIKYVGKYSDTQLQSLRTSVLVGDESTRMLLHPLFTCDPLRLRPQLLWQFRWCRIGHCVPPQCACDSKVVRWRQKMRKTFVCGNWPQVQETSNPYSLQVEQKALKEETNPLEQTGFGSCGNWPKNHFKACKTSQLISACFLKKTDYYHFILSENFLPRFALCMWSARWCKDVSNTSWHVLPWGTVLFFSSAFKAALITHQHQRISAA